MPYRAILERLLRSVAGAEAALLLDAQGEVVVDAGRIERRHLLIAAYQGIALASARRTAAQHGAGGIQMIACRYAGGGIILCPLKDGYYFVLTTGPQVSLGVGLHRAQFARELLDKEI
jgi:predicted regulator of Ras-like GTPase activity (Roadblock/LC7/MglB family)